MTPFDRKAVRFGIIVLLGAGGWRMLTTAALMSRGRVDDWRLSSWPFDGTDWMMLAAALILISPLLMRIVGLACRHLDLIRVAILASLAASIAVILLPRGGLGSLATSRDRWDDQSGRAMGLDRCRADLRQGQCPAEDDLRLADLFADHRIYISTELIDDINTPNDPDVASHARAPDPPTTESGPPCRSGTAGETWAAVGQWGQSLHPVTRTPETWLAVRVARRTPPFATVRRRLNLVVALDVSGSMSLGFGIFASDDPNPHRRAATGETPKVRNCRLQVVTDALARALPHLDPDDRFGMVVFNQAAQVAKPLTPIRRTDLHAIQRHIGQLSTHGGTHLASGLTVARTLFEGLESADPARVENRIVLITDRRPLVRDPPDLSVFDLMQEYAKQRIYTTFVSVATALEPAEIARFDAISGTGRHAVRSAWECERLFEGGFERVARAISRDLRVTVDSDDWELAPTEGAPVPPTASGEALSVPVIFDGEPNFPRSTLGKTVVVQLRKRATPATQAAAHDSETQPAPIAAALRHGAATRPRMGEGRVRLRVTWDNPDGRQGTSSSELLIQPGSDHPEPTGDLRKAILLHRMIGILRAWIRHERGVSGAISTLQPRGEALRVSRDFCEPISIFAHHFQTEAERFRDPALTHEMAMLTQIARTARWPETPVPLQTARAGGGPRPVGPGSPPPPPARRLKLLNWPTENR